jgi:SAM-dependent methyltransferase
VLDLGCGPGLYANRLARHGPAVVGLDISEPLLRFAAAEAAALASPPRYQRASLLAPELGLAPEASRFDAVLLVNSPLGLFDAEQVDTVVRAISARLVPGGQLLCEVPAIVGNKAEDGERIEALELPFSPLHAGPHRWVRRHMSFVERGERVTHHIVQTQDGQQHEHWSRSRLFTAEHVTAVLASAGLHTRQLYGIHPGQPRRPDDETMFVWAARPAEEA